MRSNGIGSIQTWLHPESKKFSDQEKHDWLDFFLDDEIPMTELIDGVHTPVRQRWHTSITLKKKFKIFKEKT